MQDQFEETVVLAAGSPTKPRVAVGRFREGAGAGLVVVKTSPVHKLLKAHEKQKFNEKMEHLKKLRHPKVVCVFGGWVGGGRAAVMTRYLPGGSLAEYLQVRRARSDLLKEEESLSFLEQLSSGLVYLHRQRVLHGDLRAQNVYMDKTHVNAKITNFKLTELPGLQQSLGSFLCQASELAEGLPSDEKRDVWGLGLIFAELLNLDAPPVFVEEARRLTSSPPSSQLLLQMLSPEPQERPTALQVHKDVTDMITCIKEEQAEEEDDDDVEEEEIEEVVQPRHAPKKDQISRLAGDRIRRPSRARTTGSSAPANPSGGGRGRPYASAPVPAPTPILESVPEPAPEPEEPKQARRPLTRHQKQRMVQQRRAEDRANMRSTKMAPVSRGRPTSEPRKRPEESRTVRLTEKGLDVSSGVSKIRLGNPSFLLNKLLPGGNKKTAAGRKSGTTAAGRKEVQTADETNKGVTGKRNQRERERENGRERVHANEERTGQARARLEEEHGHGDKHGHGDEHEAGEKHEGGEEHDHEEEVEHGKEDDREHNEDGRDEEDDLEDEAEEEEECEEEEDEYEDEEELEEEEEEEDGEEEEFEDYEMDDFDGVFDGEVLLQPEGDLGNGTGQDTKLEGDLEKEKELKKDSGEDVGRRFIGKVD